MVHAADGAAQESPSQGRAAAGGRAGHLGAFFSQVKDAASKVCHISTPLLPSSNLVMLPAVAAAVT